MQKKLLISIIAIATLYVAMFIGVKKIEPKYVEQFNYLNDNHIRVYNKHGFKNEEQEKINNLSGVIKSEFSNTPVIAHYYLNIDEEDIYYTTQDALGYVIPEDSKYQKELDFIEGTYLTDTNQVIITDRLADAFSKLEGVSRDKVLGSTFGHNLTIVGIYKDQDIDQNFVSSMGNDLSGETNVTYYNSFYTFNMQQQVPKDLAILTVNDESYNYTTMSSTNPLKIDCEPSSESKEEIKVTNENYFLWSDYYLYNSNCKLDYEASVAAGAENLIDPNTTEYGEQFNQYLLLTVEEQNRDAIVSEINTMYPDSAVITSDTKYSDFKNINENRTLMIISTIVIVIMIFVPRIELRTKK